MRRLLPSRLNSLSSPSQRRRAWLALWAQDRRRGRAVPAVPVLTLLDDLAAYWPLDEEGETRWDVNGMDVELTPDVRAVPGPAIVPWAYGKINLCPLFADNWDEYTGLGQMDLVSPGALPFSAVGDFSFSVWMYSDYGMYSGQHYVCKDNEFIAWVGSDGQVGVAFYSNGYATQIGQPVGSGFLFSEWNHLVCTKAGNVARLYLNGALAGTVTLSGLVTDNGGVWRVGGGEFGYQVNGYLDELGIWQRALSAAEVSELYNSGDGLAYEWF